MRYLLNRYITLVIVFIVLINFYLAPKSIVAYNTKNLAFLSILADNNSKIIQNHP